MRKGIMTFQPHNAQKFRVHGFRARMATKGGRKALAVRGIKGRARLAVQNLIGIRIEEQRDYLTTTSLLSILSMHLKLYECRGLRGIRRFPSIRDNREFRQIYESGGARVDRNLMLYLRFRSAGDSRTGISASKEIGNSVVRHRITRVSREVFRLHRHTFTSPCDPIFAV